MNAASASNASFPTTVAYIANADSCEISVLRIDARSGDVTVLDAVKTGGTVMPLAVSRDKRFLYASIRSEPLEVLSYAIDASSGALSPIGRAPLPASMCWIHTDRSGRFLLSASYGGSAVAVSPIGPDGVVGPSTQLQPTALNAHSIQADPSNRWAFAACLGGGVLLGYDIDAATGHLAPHAEPAWKSREGAGPRHFQFHPNGRFVYLLHELDASIDVMSFDASAGRFAATQTVAAIPPGTAGAPWAADIHLTPDGRFLYTCERRSSTLVAFAVDAATGRLTRIGFEPTETQPRSFAIDASGRWLLIVGQVSNRFSLYAIDAATGALAKHTEGAVGLNPNWVEIVALP